MIQARSMVEIIVLGLIETHKPARWEGVMKVYVSSALCILVLDLVRLLVFFTITKKTNYSVKKVSLRKFTESIQREVRVIVEPLALLLSKVSMSYFF